MYRIILKTYSNESLFLILNLIIASLFGCVTSTQIIALMGDAYVPLTIMKQSSFSELLENAGSVPIHMRNIQSLAIEMFCHHKKLSP